MVSIHEVTAWALAFPDAIQLPHFEKISFRIKKGIFVTLDTVHRRAVLKLSEVDQSVFSDYNPTAIYPVTGAWGKQGWTTFELPHVRKTMFKDALQTAYSTVALKRTKKKPGKKQ